MLALSGAQVGGAQSLLTTSGKGVGATHGFDLKLMRFAKLDRVYLNALAILAFEFVVLLKAEGDPVQRACLPRDWLLLSHTVNELFIRQAAGISLAPDIPVL